MIEPLAPSVKRLSPSRSSEAAVKHGKKLLSEKRFEEALSEFEALVERDQATPFVHVAIGRIKFKEKDLDAALKHFHAAIELDPTQSQPYLRAGRIYLMRGEMEKAKEAFENTLRLNSKSAVAHAGLGLVHLRGDRLEAAVEEWKAALSISPRMLAVRKRLAMALRKLGRPSDAVAQVNAALRIKPDDSESYVIKGRFCLLDNDYKNAQQAYERAVELDPEGKRLTGRLGLAEAYLEDGSLDKAERVMNEIPQREQFSALVHKLWGDLYTARGMHKEATEEYRSASLIAGEDLNLEGIDDLEFLLDDADDDKWEGLAASAKRAATGILQRKRHLD